MVKTITKKNINSVLNDVIKQLDKAGNILNSPSCESDEIGQIRNNAYNACREAYEKVREEIHKLYL